MLPTVSRSSITGHLETLEQSTNINRNINFQIRPNN